MNINKRIILLTLCSTIFCVLHHDFLIAMDQPQKIALPYKSLEEFGTHIQKIINEVKQQRAIEQQKNSLYSLNVFYQTFSYKNFTSTQQRQYNEVLNIQVAYAVNKNCQNRKDFSHD